MKIAGYTFRDRSFLEKALTHSSYANEHPETQSNERLEFLGDAVLGFLSGEYLFLACPEKAEGDLTKIRARYVCEGNLALAARSMGLNGMLRLGRGESAEKGAERPSVLADAFEAVLAAVFLDGGIEPCRELVKNVLMSRPADEFGRDAKSRLQEILQGCGKPAPIYRTLSESGPDHKKFFEVEVLIDGIRAATGKGKNKKTAEQAAAAAALEGDKLCEEKS